MDSALLGGLTGCTRGNISSADATSGKGPCKSEISTDTESDTITTSGIFPSLSFRPNPRGIAHYRRVFDMLIAANIEPYVTLFHFDLPSALEKPANESAGFRGGWLNSRIADAFAYYAELCFRAFPQVRHWITINEAHTVATQGYLYGIGAPGRCSDRSRCAEGDGSTEPYVAAHNMLRAHGKAADVWRKMFGEIRIVGDEVSESDRKGRSLSFVVSGDWTEPWRQVRHGPSPDLAASQRRQEFQIGWFLDPIFFGDYPASMRTAVKPRLPQFTPEERDSLRNSVSYLAINHYTSRFGAEPEGGCPRLDDSKSLGIPANDDPAVSSESHRNPMHSAGSSKPTWDDDQCCAVRTTDSTESGRAIGPQAGSDWLLAVPWGFRKLLLWLKDRYNTSSRMPILVTENGCDDTAAAWNQIDDSEFRVEQYFKPYLAELEKSMVEHGVQVIGYFAWSLLDNFEWSDGYRRRFGIVNVDTGVHSESPETLVENQNRSEAIPAQAQTPLLARGFGSKTASLKRTPKHSFWWLKNYIRDWRERESFGAAIGNGESANIRVLFV
eukprot:TRINITY_DN74508_c0_g1_i1.p1 TRINITY_DN74508_c0_g1~~TRINITY_DN74508_c0_g1_i1.p1  ORF type:complete len:637 (-),score=44.24 TRINITY_DN74508_c0_g1_i1:133-1794(-)